MALPRISLGAFSFLAEVLFTNIEVFLTNIQEPRPRALCESGLFRLLRSGALPEDTLHHFDMALNDDDRRNLPHSIVEALLNDQPVFGRGTHCLRGIVEWPARQSDSNPLSVLPVMEEVVGALERKKEKEGNTFYLTSSDSGTVLGALLREADESGDPDVTRWVLNLHGRFIQLGVPGVDKMLDAASRP